MVWADRGRRRHKFPLRPSCPCWEARAHQTSISLRHVRMQEGEGWLRTSTCAGCRGWPRLRLPSLRGPRLMSSSWRHTRARLSWPSSRKPTRLARPHPLHALSSTTQHAKEDGLNYCAESLWQAEQEVAAYCFARSQPDRVGPQAGDQQEDKGALDVAPPTRCRQRADLLLAMVRR